ncbi:hypothetical protein Pelo_5662 [Pelomyxa schiedti]|nr:hypothetical protein Pelo_5662 [Pelomyxa schiedti]
MVLTTVVGGVLVIGDASDAMRNTRRAGKLLCVDSDAEVVATAHHGLRTMRVPIMIAPTRRRARSCPRRPSQHPDAAANQQPGATQIPSSPTIVHNPSPKSARHADPERPRARDAADASGTTKVAVNALLETDNIHDSHSEEDDFAESLTKCFDFVNDNNGISNSNSSSNASSNNNSLPVAAANTGGWVANESVANQDTLMKQSTVVYCATGNNQSVVMAIAYLVAFCGMSLMSAASFMKRSRPSAAPAEYYLQQLLGFEKSLLQRSSATLESLVNIFRSSHENCAEMEAMHIPNVQAKSNNNIIDILGELTADEIANLNRPAIPRKRRLPTDTAADTFPLPIAAPVTPLDPSPIRGWALPYLPTRSRPAALNHPAAAQFPIPAASLHPGADTTPAAAVAVARALAAEPGPAPGPHPAPALAAPGAEPRRAPARPRQLCASADEAHTPREPHLPAVPALQLRLGLPPITTTTTATTNNNNSNVRPPTPMYPPAPPPPPARLTSLFVLNPGLVTVKRHAASSPGDTNRGNTIPGTGGSLSRSNKSKSFWY